MLGEPTGYFTRPVFMKNWLNAVWKEIPQLVVLMQYSSYHYYDHLEWNVTRLKNRIIAYENTSVFNYIHNHNIFRPAKRQPFVCCNSWIWSKITVTECFHCHLMKSPWTIWTCNSCACNKNCKKASSHHHICKGHHLPRWWTTGHPPVCTLCCRPNQIPCNCDWCSNRICKWCWIRSRSCNQSHPRSSKCKLQLASSNSSFCAIIHSIRSQCRRFSHPVRWQ